MSAALKIPCFVPCEVCNDVAIYSMQFDRIRFFIFTFCAAGELLDLRMRTRVDCAHALDLCACDLKILAFSIAAFLKVKGL